MRAASGMYMYGYICMYVCIAPIIRALQQEERILC
jgi:hypothetical protein